MVSALEDKEHNAQIDSNTQLHDNPHHWHNQAVGREVARVGFGRSMVFHQV